jgi:hypothetical protein
MGLLRALADATSGKPHVPPWLWASIVVGHGLAVAVLLRAVRASRRATRIRQALMEHDWSAVPEGARPSRLLTLGAVVGPVLILGATILALQRFRGFIVQGFGPPVPEAPPGMVTLGHLGELTATIAGALGLVLPLLLGAVAAALAESAHRRSRGLLRAVLLASRDPPASQAWATFPGPRAAVLAAVFLAFVLLTLGPILWSAFSGMWRVLRAVDPELGLDLPERIAFINAAQLAATRTFEHGHLASSVGAVCAGLGSAFLLWRASPARARAKLLGRPGGARPSRRGAAAAVLLVGACALLALAQPMKRENETPWPPGHALGLDWLPKLQTAEIDGPDELERGALIKITSSGQSLDWSEADPVGIRDRLVTYRNNFALLHPGQPFRPRVLLACSPDVSADRVFQLLWRVLQTDFNGVSFVFQTTESLSRPVLGAITWTNLTAANVWLTVAAAPVGATILSPDPALDCGALSARIVALRRAGREVVLVPPPSWLENHDWL